MSAEIPVAVLDGKRSPSNPKANGDSRTHQPSRHQTPPRLVITPFLLYQFQTPKGYYPLPQCVLRGRCLRQFLAQRFESPGFVVIIRARKGAFPNNVGIESAGGAVISIKLSGPRFREVHGRRRQRGVRRSFPIASPFWLSRLVSNQGWLASKVPRR